MLMGFLGYVRRDRISIETGLPWRRGYKGALPPGADSLGGGFCRIGFATVPYRVVDLHGRASEDAVLCESNYFYGSSCSLSPRLPTPSM